MIGRRRYFAELTMSEKQEGLYIVLISIHGLIRGQNLELGRDSDTGGQTRYVVELAKALSDRPEVARVDLITRLIQDPKVDQSYAQILEPIAEHANIVRVACGPQRYIRKELLWPYLEDFVDNTIRHFRSVGRMPDIIHGHYADAGLVGTTLSKMLGIPLVFTGHSLGREKRQRLLDQGANDKYLERQYRISQRIEAEETTLRAADLVIASSSDEKEQQYSTYHHYHHDRVTIIPPGVDLDSFHPPDPKAPKSKMWDELNEQLHNPEHPIILALSRPDERKNLPTLVRTYIEHPELSEKANLAIYTSHLSEQEGLEEGPKHVITEVLALIQGSTLKGRIALPQRYGLADIPEIYRVAALSRGVLVNPALAEPFGLTLLEAAASGLPIVATEEGGPRDIVEFCQDGLLVDPLNREELAKALLDAVTNREQWERWSANGLEGVKRHYSWSGHVATYLKAIHKLLERKKWTRIHSSRLATADRLLICDIDNTLLGDAEGLHLLIDHLEEAQGKISFGVATGRRLHSAVEILEKSGVTFFPDFLITAVGSEIHYGPGHVEDAEWQRHTDYLWKPDSLKRALSDMPGLTRQPHTEQRRHKVSYYVNEKIFPGVEEVEKRLDKRGLHAKIIYSHGEFLDLLPLLASKGLAIEFLANKWGFELDHILVGGDSGNDDEMLTCGAYGVVVGNYSKELEPLKGHSNIYFAKATYAKGVLEGMEHFNFLKVMSYHS
jgi:sucrose-phosphate synthase